MSLMDSLFTYRPLSENRPSSISFFFSSVIQLIIVLSFLSLTTALASHCRTSCGNIPINYPFGIDDGCGSPYYRHILVCSEPGNLELRTPSGRYPVLSISYSDPHILVTDPFMWNCHDGDNFRPTRPIALSVPAELESALRLKAVQYFVTKRPWLDLYGINVKPVAPVGSVSRKPYVDPALIHRCLPDELLFEVFARMTPYDLGRATCVCRKWRYTIRNPVFWRSSCLKAWQLSGVVENYKVLQSRYEGSWRKMWLLRPRVRTDGLYVSRNTYIRAGVAEWKVTNPVHLVCYFRYMRFFPSGRFLYKNSSHKVKDVAKYMNFRTSKAEGVFRGHYTLSDDQVEAAVLYPGMRPTVLRIRLRLRGTTTGANNRMDLLSLLTSGVSENEVKTPDEDILGVVEGWQDDESHNPDVPAVSHKRGMMPFVFVPFEEVETSVLNLPVEKMDYFVPG